VYVYVYIYIYIYIYVYNPASQLQVEKELALKPVFLFSRREGVMIKKMANPYSSSKLIDVGCAFTP